jgi:hypothetical protein
MAKRRSDRKAKLKALLGNKCAWCDSLENTQFDHIDPRTKSFAISGRSLDFPWEKLLEELAKCQLLCFWCHVEKSRHENSIRLASVVYEHGSYSKYRREKCRCDICIVAMREKRRKWRGNK